MRGGKGANLVAEAPERAQERVHLNSSVLLLQQGMCHLKAPSGQSLPGARQPLTCPQARQVLKRALLSALSTLPCPALI